MNIKIFKILSMLLTIFLMIVLVSGCGSNKYNRFVGTWTGIQDPNNPQSDVYQISIDENDSKFIIRTRKYQYTENNKWVECPEKFDDALLKDNKLIKDQNACFGVGKLFPATYSYEKDKNAIFYSGYGGFYLYKDTDNKVLNDLLSYKR